MAFQLFKGDEGDWGDVPRELGMKVDERGLLVGTWNGRIPIRGLHTYRMVRNANTHQDERHYYTELYAVLDPPLLMGVRVRERSTLGRLFGGAFGQEDIHVGHPDFDQRFTVKGLDADHVRRVFAGPPGPLLLGFAGKFPELWISDQYVTVEHSGYERDLAKVRAALAAVGQLGEVVLAQRARERAAWEPALRAAWGPVAEGWQLPLDGERATIAGVARGLPVEVRARIVEDRFTTEVRFTLPAPPPCAISLSPQNGDGFFRRLFRGQDIQVGDAAFDAAFVIKGEPEPAVRALLGPAARQWLMAARARTTELELDEGVLCLKVAELVLSGSRLDDLLKHGFEATEALCPGLGGGGPYR